MSNRLDLFSRLSDHRQELFTLNGEFCLIELIEGEKKTKSGIYLAEKKDQIAGVYSDRPVFARVLLVGEGYYDDDTKKPIKLDVNAGDIVLVGAQSVRRFSYFGPVISCSSDGAADLGLIREGDIQMRFLGEEGYNKTMTLLEGDKEAPVGLS